MHEFRNKQDIPAIVVDKEGTIIFVNAIFLKTYLYQENDLIGQHVTRIIPPELHDAHNLGFSRFLMTKQSKIMGQALPLKVLKKDDTVIDATHFITAYEDEQILEIGATIEPITS